MFWLIIFLQRSSQLSIYLNDFLSYICLAVFATVGINPSNAEATYAQSTRMQRFLKTT